MSRFTVFLFLFSDVWGVIPPAVRICVCDWTQGRYCWYIHVFEVQKVLLMCQVYQRCVADYMTKMSFWFLAVLNTFVTFYMYRSAQEALNWNHLPISACCKCSTCSYNLSLNCWWKVCMKFSLLHSQTVQMGIVQFNQLINSAFRILTAGSQLKSTKGKFDFPRLW